MYCCHLHDALARNISFSLSLGTNIIPVTILHRFLFGFISWNKVCARNRPVVFRKTMFARNALRKAKFHTYGINQGKNGSEKINIGKQFNIDS